MKRAILLLLLSLLPTVLFPQPALAQENQPQGPVYIVQPGDNLYNIALQFGLSLDDLRAANPGLNPDLLSPGQRLVIPGLPENIQGVLTTHKVGFGEEYRALVRQFNQDEDLLQRLNRLTTPSELYAGYSLILIQAEGEQPDLQPVEALQPGQSPLEAALLADTSPWTLSAAARQLNPAHLIPGDPLFLPASEFTPSDRTAGMLQSLSLWPLPLYQGATAQLTVQLNQPAAVSGTLGDYPLQFYPLTSDPPVYVALQGIHALLTPGLYPIALTITPEDGSPAYTLQQMVSVRDGGYYSEQLVVPAYTIDPETNQRELDWLLEQVTANPTAEKLWQGVFQNPSYFPDCFTSRYGTRRVYMAAENSSLSMQGFHSGLDFCGGAGLPITAPADGRVIFAGPLDIRGNATLIDHGWGVYTGYWHQSEIYVQAGDLVKQGQTIGLVGGTGRVTGAHLHWEVWVNGVQVNPMTWLQTAFPRTGE